MLRKLILILVLVASSGFGTFFPTLSDAAGIQQFSNNSVTTLAAPITSTSATSLTVTSSALFPTPSGGNWFIATLEHLVSGVVTAQEIVKVTLVSGSTWTIARGQEGTTPTTWVTGDTIALLPTAGGLSQFVQPTQAQSQSYNYAVDVGSANAYSVTLAPALTAHVIGMPIRFKAANANSGASNFNDGTGSASLVATSGQSLKGGEIQAGGLYVASWDGTRFQLTSSTPLVPVANYSFFWPSNGSQINYRIATLPASTAGTTDSIHIIAELNQTWASSGTSTVDLVVGNRNGFNYYWSAYGTLPPAVNIDCYLESDGSVNVLLEGGAGIFGYARVSVINVGGGATLYANPQPIGDSGTGIFSSSLPSTYIPLFYAANASTYINAAQIAATYDTITDVNSKVATAQSTAISTSEAFATGAANTAQSNAETFAASQAATAQSNAETFAAAQASAAQANAESFTSANFVANTAIGATTATKLGGTSGISTAFTSITFSLPVVGGASYALTFESDLNTTAGVGSLNSRIAVTGGSGSITAVGSGLCLGVSGAGGGGTLIWAQNNPAGMTNVSITNSATPHEKCTGSFSVGASVTAVAFQLSLSSGSLTIPAGGYVSLLRTN